LATIAKASFLCLPLAVLFLQGCSTGPSAADSSKKGGKKGGGAAVPVVVATVAQKDVPIELTVVGNVEAYNTISIIPQIGGQLNRVYFHEGDFVKKGDHLFTIDPRPYQAALSQAQANLARDTAALGQAQANLARDTASQAYAVVEANRYQKLFEEGVVSKEQGDQFRTNADTLAQSVLADKAAIESSRAQMLADQAAIDTAKVSLSYTEIDSPIDGRTGNLMVKEGNVVAANATALISIAQIEPIYVTFAVPESKLPDIKQYMAAGPLQVAVKPQDGKSEIARGQLTFIDNNVDMTTGTIKLKGTFTNADRVLWPGQYLNVVLRLTTQPNALTVPNQAVQSGQDGSFVYVVKEDRTVEARPVVTGTRVNDDLVIQKGVAIGETVVTEGQLRLAPGSTVQFGNGKNLQRPPG